MRTMTLLATVMLSTLLTSCSEKQPPVPPAPTPKAAAATTEPPTEIKKEEQGVLTDTQRQGFNAANQMSDTLKKAEEERRKQMEAQGI